MEKPHAQIFEVNGQLVLDDPTAVGMIRAVGKYNCLGTLKAQRERVQHFINRMNVLERSPEDVVIVLINVDDIHGRHLADILMPGHDWQQYRSKGEVPYARGLAERAGIQEAIGLIDQDAGEKLKKHKGIAVVVVDFDTAEIFSPEDE
jgi:hypothetical protein